MTKPSAYLCTTTPFRKEDAKSTVGRSWTLIINYLATTVGLTVGLKIRTITITGSNEEKTFSLSFEYHSYNHRYSNHWNGNHNVNLKNCFIAHAGEQPWRWFATTWFDLEEDISGLTCSANFSKAFFSCVQGQYDWPLPTTERKASGRKKKIEKQ